MTPQFSLDQEWSWFTQMLPGLWVSLQLTAASLIIGLPLGLAFAVATTNRQRAIRWVVIALVELGRGTPALVLVYLVYFGLPQMGLTLSGFICASIAIGLSTGAYASEIFRGGLLGVPRGQLEAAQAIGLGRFKQLRLVILPQAVRIVIPPILGLAIIVFQATSLAYVIGLPELLSRAYNLGAVTFQFLAMLTLAGVMYALIAIPASRFISRLER